MKPPRALFQLSKVSLHTELFEVPRYSLFYFILYPEINMSNHLTFGCYSVLAFRILSYTARKWAYQVRIYTD